MSFQRAKSGDDLKIPARDWNACLDAAEAYASRRGGGAVTRSQGDGGGEDILIKNTTAVDLDRFAVLGITGVIIDPADNEQEFKNRIALTGTTPTTADHAGKFAVLQEPCAAGKIARARLDGLTVCKIDAADSDQYADVADDDATMLKGASSGSSRILWRATGTGAQWAIARLQGSGSSAQELYVAAEWGDYLECKTDPFATEDPIYVAKPRSLRRSLDEGTSGNITVTYQTNFEKVISDSGSPPYPDERLRITPTYTAGLYPARYIVAMSIGETGVTRPDPEGGSDIPVTLIDLNVDARQWAEVLFL